MKISIQATPLEYFPYKNVAPRNPNDKGVRQVEDVLLPIYQGTVAGLPKGLDGLIIASDLQGIDEVQGETLLLGETLPDFLSTLLALEMPHLSLKKMGVILCGDLYAQLDKRGGTGDVRNVWLAFKKHFGFVVGVAGNHDLFGSPAEMAAFQRSEDLYYLDGTSCSVQGISFSGLGGIIGRPTKPNRLEEAAYLKELKKLLLKKPDFMLSHEGPNSIEPKQKGNEAIRAILENSPATIVLCGHNHWKETMVGYGDGGAVVNVDGKCLVLERESEFSL